jgi:hypothetical protein
VFNSFDAGGRLRSRSFQLTAAGQTTTVTAWANWTPQDKLANLTDRAVSGASAPQLSAFYRYDADGRLLSQPVANVAPNATFQYLASYSYDQNSQLAYEYFNGTGWSNKVDGTGQRTGDGRVSYTLDANGNRTGNATATSPSPAPGNEIKQDQNWIYIFDINGNLQSKISQAQVPHLFGDPDQETHPVAMWQFRYNQSGQLIEDDGLFDYSDGNRGTTSKDGIYSQDIKEVYSYDALGRLVKVTTTTRNEIKDTQPGHTVRARPYSKSSASARSAPRAPARCRAAWRAHWARHVSGRLDIRARRC